MTLFVNKPCQVFGLRQMRPKQELPRFLVANLLSQALPQKAVEKNKNKIFYIYLNLYLTIYIYTLFYYYFYNHRPRRGHGRNQVG